MHFISRNLLFITLICIFPSAHAGIVLDSTRVVYPASKQDVTFGITNNSTSPRLIQAWVDNGDPESTPDSATAPFLITPPISRINTEKSQSLRILFTGGNVPQDRESVFWLNVLEVQPKPSTKAAGTTGNKDYIQFSIRSRIKIFYRPQGLPGSPEAATASLRWRAVEGGLECENPSAFNVSINDITFQENGGNSGDRHNGMCPAKGKKVFVFKNNVKKNNRELFLSVIDDYGALIKSKATWQD